MFTSICLVINLVYLINVVNAGHHYYNHHGEPYHGGEGWGYDDFLGTHYDKNHRTSLLKPQEPEKMVMSTTPTAPVPTSTEPTDNRNSVYSYNPCDPYVSQKPDYASFLTKLSDVKCYDYIWKIHDEEIQMKRADDCFIEEIIRKGGEAIMGGRLSKRGEFPHMAAIGWRTTTGSLAFKCGGSIISERYILTAGHCTRAAEDTNLADLQPKIVRLGRNNIGETVMSNHKAKDVNISEIIPHPMYAPPKKYYDIALLRVEEEIIFNSDIYPACLWTDMSLQSSGFNGTVTGWGVEKLGDQRTSVELKAAEVNLVDSLMCDSLLEPYCNRHWCGVGGHQLCAGTLAGGTDTCQGDSGGPIQVKMNVSSDIKHDVYLILGVTSFGFKCGLPNVPGIYTRVASFRDWIENIVWK